MALTAEQQRWMDEYIGQQNQFNAGGQASYDAGDQLVLDQQDPNTIESLDPSQMASISTDPRYKNAELTALSDLEQRSRSGLTPQDEADMFRLQQQVNTENRGRVGAIRDQMASRGMGGSGMDAMMQLQSAQDAGEREALAAMEKAGQTQNARMSATQQLGQLGSNLQGREFAQKQAQAQAADSIKKFNAANRIGAQQSNLQSANTARTANFNRANNVSDQNASSGYKYRTDALQGGQRVAEAGMNAATQDENARILNEQQKRRQRQGQMSAIGGVIGGGLGAFGGPVGAAAGYQVGSGLGNVAGMSEGGDVEYPDGISENDLMPGDHPSNDMVPTLLSPGEKVLSREQVALNDYISRLKEQTQAQRDAVDSAKTGKTIADYGSVFNNFANDLSKSQRHDAVLASNPFTDGSVPRVAKGYQPKVTDIASGLANQNLAGAQADLGKSEQSFGRNEQLKDQFGNQMVQRDKLNRDNVLTTAEDDPNSQVSKMYQDLAKKLRPQSDFSQMSATQIKTGMGPLQKTYEVDQISEAKKTSAAQRQQDRLDSNDIRNQMIDAKKQEKVGELTVPGVGIANTPDDAKKLKDATELKDKFDRQLSEMIDLRKEYGFEVANRSAVARSKQLSKDLLLTYKDLSKLGVLSKSDEDILNAIIPPDPLGYAMSGSGDDPILEKMNKFKSDAEADYQARLKTRLKENFNPQVGKTGPDKPKSVVQDGHTYILNEATGEYE